MLDKILNLLPPRGTFGVNNKKLTFNTKVSDKNTKVSKFFIENIKNKKVKVLHKNSVNNRLKVAPKESLNSQNKNKRLYSNRKV